MVGRCALSPKNRCASVSLSDGVQEQRTEIYVESIILRDGAGFLVYGLRTRHEHNLHLRCRFLASMRTALSTGKFGREKERKTAKVQGKQVGLRPLAVSLDGVPREPQHAAEE